MNARRKGTPVLRTMTGLRKPQMSSAVELPRAVGRNLGRFRHGVNTVRTVGSLT